MEEDVRLHDDLAHLSLSELLILWERPLEPPRRLAVLAQLEARGHATASLPRPPLPPGEALPAATPDSRTEMGPGRLLLCLLILIAAAGALLARDGRKRGIRSAEAALEQLADRAPEERVTLSGHEMSAREARLGLKVALVLLTFGPWNAAAVLLTALLISLRYPATGFGLALAFFLVVCALSLVAGGIEAADVVLLTITALLAWQTWNAWRVWRRRDAPVLSEAWEAT